MHRGIAYMLPCSVICYKWYYHEGLKQYFQSQLMQKSFQFLFWLAFFLLYPVEALYREELAFHSLRWQQVLWETSELNLTAGAPSPSVGREDLKGKRTWQRNSQTRFTGQTLWQENWHGGDKDHQSEALWTCENHSDGSGQKSGLTDRRGS